VPGSAAALIRCGGDLRRHLAAALRGGIQAPESTRRDPLADR